ncbi:MAG: SpoVA/SpoVAEb family sporulation membrane protein [Ruminococcaceae bacterium]|nr:SpoVA/SpoVAEb family sporulation membrane protein [Oscillospiraceae bacterium]
MNYLYAFFIGGILCVPAQILLDKTKITNARILTGYVVAGVFLSALTIYTPIVNFASAGATVPLTGFGYALANGVRDAVDNDGLIGVLTGGLSGTAAGITAAMCFALVFTLFFKSRQK